MSAERQDRERWRHLLMAEVDGELSPDERRELEQALERDPELRRERERMRRVREVTQTMKLRTPPDEIWQDYWISVYNRFERGLGWALFSLGIVTLLVWGSWEAVSALVADENVPPLVKFALFAAAAGGLVLVFSVAREKLFTARRDPYKEIQR